MTADQITADDDVSELSDRQLLERVARQLDHLDEMAHADERWREQFAPLLPLVPRALALLDPAATMRRHLRPSKGKVNGDG